MTLPALHAMQRAGIALQLLGKPWLKDLFAATGMDIFSLDKEFWTIRNQIKQIPTDNLLLFTNSFSSALSSRLAGKKTIGYKTDMRHLLLKKGLDKPSGLHEVEYFWNLARFACRYFFPELIWDEAIPETIELPVSPPMLNHANELLTKAGVTSPFWLLCPFAHGKSRDNKSKVWPYWPDLSRKLAHHNVVVCPGPNEVDLCEQLVPGARVLSGLNLSEYAAVLSLADKVIANDSGPMHIASAVNANTFGIFGVTDPARTRPWNSSYIGRKDEWPSVDEVWNVVVPKL